MSYTTIKGAPAARPVAAWPDGSVTGVTARGTWTPTRTSDDYTPAVLLWPDGCQRRCNVLRVRLDSVEGARRKLAAGQCAWVRVEDVERVTGTGDGK